LLSAAGGVGKAGGLGGWRRLRRDLQSLGTRQTELRLRRNALRESQHQSREGPSARASLHCRNCSAYAPEQYCPRCGQDTAEHLPTAWEFVHEHLLHYFAAEGRLWRTLRALVFHPGLLTLEYLRGRKRTYVSPLRLYLTMSVVYFFALQLATAPAAEHARSKFHRKLNDGHTSINILDLEGLGLGKAVRSADGSLSCSLPSWVCNRIQERVLRPGELENRVGALTELYSHLSTAVFLLLPVFALFLQLAYLRRAYGEHFLFALHLHSFWFLLLLALLLPMPQWLGWLVIAYLLAYSAAALHRVYAAAWWKTVLKGLAIGAAYSVSLFIATALIIIGTILR
jgi:hypothetical protein